MDIAVYGGSFSPVHQGHMAVASGVLERGLADEVWMMPCRRNPLKTENSVWKDSDRIEMLQKAIEYAGDPRIRISTLELEMPSPSYTCNTFRKLMELYPDFRFRLIAGADSYLDFHKWRESQWLEATLKPIVYPRPGYEIRSLRPGWTLLEDVPQVDISSSEIRKMMAENRPLGHLLPWIL